MGKKKVKTPEVYSAEKLLNDICNQYGTELEVDDKDMMRDKIYKLNILSRIINLTGLVYNNNETILRISSSLAENADFYGYTYFLSSNRQFYYSWSYLRKQWKVYEEKLKSVVQFLIFMISAINAVSSLSDDLTDYELLFADVFDVSFKKENHSPIVNISWENMNNLFLIDKGYTISVKSGGIEFLSKYYIVNKKGDVAKFLQSLKEALEKLSFEE